jgi:biopolymer transport protein ExbD
MAKFKKNVRAKAEIPTASMSDIAFLLLIFFMITTKFVAGKGLTVNLPKVSSEVIEKIVRKNAATIYVNPAGQISIDDFQTNVDTMGDNLINIMTSKSAANPNLVTCFRTDENTQYGLMSDIMKQLQTANALRISFEARRKFQ